MSNRVLARPRIGYTLAMLFAGAVGGAWAADPVAVHVAELRSLLRPAVGDAPATVISLNDAWLEAEISAPVGAITKRVGEAVAEGETVVRLDCSRFDRERDLAAAQIAVLTARQNLAEQQLERARGLRRSKNIAEETFNQREAEFAAAQAETQAQRVALTIARDNVARCEIKAPFAGVVAAREAQLGEFAAPGKALVRILDTLKVELSAQLPVREIAALRDAERATYRHNDEDFAVRVRAIVPRVETGTRTQEIRLTFEDALPPPGASGRLVWQLQSDLLPAEYLVRRTDSLGVFVARDGKAVYVSVPGAREGRPARVDLPARALVITAGRYGVADGDSIIATRE